MLRLNRINAVQTAPLMHALLGDVAPRRGCRHVNLPRPEQPERHVAAGIGGRRGAHEVLTFVKGLYFVKRCVNTTDQSHNAHSIAFSERCVAVNSTSGAFPRPPTHAPAFFSSEPGEREVSGFKADRPQKPPSGSAVHRMNTNLATIAPPPAPIEPITDKPVRISRKISEAIRLITTGECSTLKAASERAKVNYTHLCETLKKPHIRVFIERKSRETIAAGTMRASARLIGLLDASSEHVSLDATKHVLAIAGIKPSADAQVSVNIDIKAGYVIDLSDSASLNTHLPRAGANPLISHDTRPDKPGQLGKPAQTTIDIIGQSGNPSEGAGGG